MIGVRRGRHDTIVYMQMTFPAICASAAILCVAWEFPFWLSKQIR